MAWHCCCEDFLAANTTQHSVSNTRVPSCHRKGGKRRKVDKKNLGGGEVVVKELLGPTIKSLGVAVHKYRDVFAEQSRDIGMLDVEG